MADADLALLDRLLHPLGHAEFHASVWESRVLHVTREANPDLGGYLDELVSLDTIDGLLATAFTHGTHAPNTIRLGHGGAIVPPGSYQRHRDTTAVEYDVAEVLRRFRGGSSLILNNLQRYHEPVALLCDALTRIWGVRVNVNCYITPPHTQGFPLHFDSHDVLLLQVAGTKIWNLHPPFVELADAGHQRDAYDEPTDEPERIVLAAGEALYLPRGVLHEGKASDSLSMHLTVGIHPYTRAQLLRDVISALEREDVEFRRSVTARLPLFDPGSGEFEKALAMIVDRLLRSGSAGEVADRAVAEARAELRPGLHGAFRRAAAACRLTDRTKVQLRSGVDASMEPMGDRLMLAFADRVLTMPRYLTGHVEALCAGRAVDAESLPPTVDLPGRLTLVRRLVHEGLLEPV